MRIVITGALGYMGQHLCQTLLSVVGVELHGLFRTPRTHLLPPSLTLHQLDLYDRQKTTEIIRAINPDLIYHLAGNIHAGRKDNYDHLARRDNVEATRNLYDACLQLRNLPRIVYASTGAVYGQAEGVITEATPLKPLNPYAASKATADISSASYWHESGLPIIRARIFNYLGPGQDDSTALSRFAHQLARLEQESDRPAVLHVGNLDAERDFLDVADVIRALVLLMEKGQPGEAYNVASGINHPMRWYLDRLLEHVSIPVTVQYDETLGRPGEAQKLQVDVTRLKQQTAWKPLVPLDQTLASMIDSCRARLQLGKNL